MNPDQLKDEAQAFLDFYIRGSSAPGVEALFPNAFEPGIRHRTPAALGVRIEREAIEDPDHDRFFEAGEGPEVSDQRYLYLDSCGLEMARVVGDGQILQIRLIFVVSYPPGRFPGRASETTPILLPSSTDTLVHIQTECIHALEEYLGGDSDGFPAFNTTFEVLELADFEQRVQDGDL